MAKGVHKTPRSLSCPVWKRERGRYQPAPGPDTRSPGGRPGSGCERPAQRARCRVGRVESACERLDGAVIAERAVIVLPVQHSGMNSHWLLPRPGPPEIPAGLRLHCHLDLCERGLSHTRDGGAEPVCGVGRKRAAPGFTVVVDVSAGEGSRSASCSGGSAYGVTGWQAPTARDDSYGSSLRRATTAAELARPGGSSAGRPTATRSPSSRCAAAPATTWRAPPRWRSPPLARRSRAGFRCRWRR